MEVVETAELSVIVPVAEWRYDDVESLYEIYKQGIDQTGLRYEIIYVLDGKHGPIEKALNRLKQQGEQIQVIPLPKLFGGSTALNVGLEHSTGEIILVLPAYQQIDAAFIPKLVEALKNNDMAITWRWPRRDALFNRLQSKFYNWLIGHTSDLSVHDIGCSVRAFKREITEEVKLYGDLHRFFPILAYQQGFKVIELKVPQAQSDVKRRIHPIGIYIRRLLDFLTVLFLLKFIKKPLRFFGLVGTTVFSIGLILTLYIIGERLMGLEPLANRPALLISSLMIILGVQVTAIGLIGELIIFTHAKDMKEYTVKEVINEEPAGK